MLSEAIGLKNAKAERSSNSAGQKNPLLKTISTT